MTAPTLVFTWGNPSRGDDALGPMFGDRLADLAASHPEWGEIEVLTDFQLQIEHALDLCGRSRVLFVDASVDATPPCLLQRIEAVRDVSFTTHAMSPQSILQVYLDLEKCSPPPTWQLAIYGSSFELGEGLSAAARGNLEAALAVCVEWILNTALNKVESGQADVPTMTANPHDTGHLMV